MPQAEASGHVDNYMRQQRRYSIMGKSFIFF
jgi:hypothetical protein